MYILQEKITPKGAKIVLETDMSSALFGYNKLEEDENEVRYSKQRTYSNAKFRPMLGYCGGMPF